MNKKIYQKSLIRIILNHTFTLFNLLNFALAVAILCFDSFKNLLFMGVVICNTLIGIIQEIYARNILKKLTVISKQVFTLKNNQTKTLGEIEKNDQIVLNIGDQVVFEGILTEGEITVDESFITGESDYITKKTGDKLLSGSFIVSGNGLLRVNIVGEDNFIYKIMNEGKKIKKIDSEIVKSLKKIIKIISIIIVPLSILIFCKQYLILETAVTRAIVNTVASILSMIPEGLILLTSTVAAISIIRLNKYNVLIQNLYATELVARTEIICFDKTGTLTTGNIHLVKTIDYDKSATDILNLITAVSKDNNKTMLAIKEKYNGISNLKVKEVIPFDSSKKYMEVITSNETYRLGSPVISNEEITNYQKKYRVLTLSNEKKVLAILLFEDELRNNIDKVIAEYQKEKIQINIISGDDINTIEEICKQAGIKAIRGIDLSKIINIDYDEVVKQYNVFGRVRPAEKRELVAALKKNGIVTYVGDGVNDVLALKEANCSITFLNAASAAKSVAEIILLNSDFETLPKIIREGRKIAGNIERSASLFLTKTVYAILLTLIFLIVNENYPFIPIQITLIGTTTIGIPGFILSLESSDDQISKNFLAKIFKRAIPSGIAVAFNVILILLLAPILKITDVEISTICLLLTVFVGFLTLYKICIPFTKLRKVVYGGCIGLFLIQFLFFSNFFAVSLLNANLLLISGILMIISFVFYQLVNRLISKIWP